jgi:hypothetical protein
MANEMSREAQVPANDRNEAMLKLTVSDPVTLNLLTETYGFHALSLKSKLTTEKSAEHVTGQPD